MIFIKPMPFKEAAAKMGKQSPIGSKMLSSEWRDVPVALRENALFSATIENIRFLGRSRDMLQDFLEHNRETVTLPDGSITTALKSGSRAKFVQEISRFAIQEGMGPLNPEDAGSIKDIRSESRLSLIWRVKTDQAYAYGDWKQGMDPDALEAFPAWRFIREQDVKQPRPYHEQNRDRVELKTNLAFWIDMNRDFGVPWGPWGFNSGMGVEDVSREEAEAARLISPGQVVQSADIPFNKRLEASTRGLDPDLVEKLKVDLGSQIEVAGDVVRWVANNAIPTPKASAAPVAPVVTPNPVTNPVASPVVIPSPSLVAVPVANPGANPVSQQTKAVSVSIDIKATGALKKSAETAISIIDKTHKDGKLDSIPLVQGNKSSLGNSLGMLALRREANGIKAVQIELRQYGSHPELTTIHEIGHFIDLDGIGSKGEFASRSGDLKDILEAIKNSKLYKGLRNLYSSAVTAHERKYYKYLLDHRELWARAYAQYIAEKSADPLLLKQVSNIIKDNPNRQWAESDFEPIKKAIDELFTKLGWL
jgi:hypothetical protein